MDFTVCSIGKNVRFRFSGKYRIDISEILSMNSGVMIKCVNVVTIIIRSQRAKIEEVILPIIPWVFYPSFREYFTHHFMSILPIIP